jgi:hypothetical protein
MSNDLLKSADEWKKKAPAFFRQHERMLQDTDNQYYAFYASLLSEIYDKYGSAPVDQLTVMCLVEQGDIPRWQALAELADLHGATRMIEIACGRVFAYRSQSFFMERVGANKSVVVELVLPKKETKGDPNLDALIRRILHEQQRITPQYVVRSQAMQAIAVRLDTALQGDDSTLRSVVSEVLATLDDLILWQDDAT